MSSSNAPSAPALGTLTYIQYSLICITVLPASHGALHRLRVRRDFGCWSQLAHAQSVKKPNRRGRDDDESNCETCVLGSCRASGGAACSYGARRRDAEARPGRPTAAAA